MKLAIGLLNFLWILTAIFLEINIAYCSNPIIYSLWFIAIISNFWLITSYFKD